MNGYELWMMQREARELRHMAYEDMRDLMEEAARERAAQQACPLTCDPGVYVRCERTPDPDLPF